MKKIIALTLLSSLNLFASPAQVVEKIYKDITPTKTQKMEYITLGNDSYELQKNSLMSRGLMKYINHNQEATLLQVDSGALNTISEVNHEQFKRCGGYFVHPTLKDAKKHLSQMSQRANLNHLFPVADYTIDQQKLIEPLVAQVDEAKIKESIMTLSGFKTRYYQSETGVEAAKWIAEKAKKLAERRSDVTVELFKHSQWLQPSVIITVQGKSKETIIIGGHLDSINSGFLGGGSAEKIAPGADDNASGISTWLEVFRILMENDYQPEKTLKFMGYAAEEVGLRGSNEIAKKYAANKEPVIGVVQLDMTNYKGAEKYIYLMTDYTNAEQNKFVGSIIDEYVKVPWGFDKCGYGCSDHASWNGQGYPASMPFEATMRGMNRNIHTANDTISVSGNNAKHAVNFAKMALAFAIELDQ